MTRTIDRSIHNPTIPRQKYKARTHVGFKKSPRLRNTGSIRHDYVESDGESEDEGKGKNIDKQITPGPGNYLKSYHTDTVGQQPILHKHP